MKQKPKSSNKTVLLGLSGGVDSSVAALLLKKQGYKVIGAFMKNFSETKNKYGQCSWIEERKFAQKIAAQLDIQFVTLDFEKEYQKYVIKPMYKSYASGFTPNPDILCNKVIKFPLLWKKAQDLKADSIATGHYARIKKTTSGFQLLAGKDKIKDQSYFLAELSQKDLAYTLFPLGNLTKNQVRQIAKKNKFPNWNKHGTVGICFVGKVSIKTFLEKKIKEKLGKVLDSKGNILGSHPGATYYTIGQTALPHIGINIKKPKEYAKKKLYIAEKIKNNLIVVPENHPMLKKQEIIVKSLHLINPKEKIPKAGLKVKIRHRGRPNSGKLIKKNNKYIFKFKKPVEAIAEGQIAVIYHKGRVIGSGEIRLK